MNTPAIIRNCFLISTALLFMACQESKKQEFPEMDEGIVGSAQLVLEDGNKVEFNGSFSFVQSIMGKHIAMSNPKNGMFLSLSIKDFANEGIEKGEYTKNASIVLKQQNHHNIIDEEYRTYYYENHEGETGRAKIILTTIEKDRIAGTFSGTLYSDSSKKVEVSHGKFDIEID